MLEALLIKNIRDAILEVIDLHRKHKKKILFRILVASSHISYLFERPLTTFKHQTSFVRILLALLLK